MECEELRRRLDAYLDAKLPRLSGRFSTSMSRAAPNAALERLRDDIRQAAPVYRAPEALRRQLRSTLRREAVARAPPAQRAPSWLAYPVATIAVYGPDDTTATKLTARYSAGRTCRGLGSPALVLRRRRCP